MHQEELVIRTKLTPPRPRRYTLHWPRLTALLLRAFDHRLTIVHAATGYGKSTALASLAVQEISSCWYSVADEDADPLVFLLHLIHACRLRLPNMSDVPLTLLERRGERLALSTTSASERGPAIWNAVVDALVNALADVLDHPTLLILDDYHLVGDAPLIATIVDRLTGYVPADLHVVLSGRHPPSLPCLVTWRARGELLEIDQRDLAFMPEEISTLFSEQYEHHLTPAEVQLLLKETEGWVIAL